MLLTEVQGRCLMGRGEKTPLTLPGARNSRIHALLWESKIALSSFIPV